MINNSESMTKHNRLFVSNNGDEPTTNECTLTIELRVFTSL